MEQIKPLFMQLTRIEQKATVEALIFSSEEPLSSQALFNILIAGDYQPAQNQINLPEEDNESSQMSLSSEVLNKFNFQLSYFEDLIDEINEELLDTNRPFQIKNVAGGWLYATRVEYGYLMQQLHRAKSKRRLTQASLETLAIIAYRQPVTKPEIDQIRGVNSAEIIHSLVEKSLVEIVGRKDALGKPILYGTTKEFLKTFGLLSLDELPKLREIDEIAGADIYEDSHIEIKVEEKDEEKSVEPGEEISEEFSLAKDEKVVEY